MTRLPRDASRDPAPGPADAGALVPRGVGPITNPQTDLPRIARDPRLTRIIDEALRTVPTHHRIVNHDARRLSSLALPAGSVHLVVTSPPYWTLKEYRPAPGQLGFVQDYEEPGASTGDHPASFPLELADRIIRMFSFVGDTVLDPFLGTGTTCLAAARVGRHSIGVELDDHYVEMARRRLMDGTSSLFGGATVEGASA